MFFYALLKDNYVPVNLFQYLAGDNVTLAVVTDRTHGGSSLQDGELEFMVRSHSRLIHPPTFSLTCYFWALHIWLCRTIDIDKKCLCFVTLHLSRRRSIGGFSSMITEAWASPSTKPFSAAGWPTMAWLCEG